MEDENTGSQVTVPVKKPPLKRKKRSSAWVDFEVSTNDDGEEIAKCKKCRKELVTGGTAGTSHLLRHQRTCPRRKNGVPPPIAAPPTIPAAPPIGAPPEASNSNLADSEEAVNLAIPAAPPIATGAPPEASNCGNPADSEEATADLANPAAASPPTPAPPTIDDARPESANCGKPADADWEEATADLARMIALHGYDPSIVEDSYFKSFVRRLNPDFQVPSRAAIEDICDGVSDEADSVLESALKGNSDVVNLVIDRTETALGPVLYVARHFIDDDWNRRQMIVDVYMDLPQDMERMPLFVRGYNLDIRYDAEELSYKIAEKLSGIREHVFSEMIGPVGDLKDLLPYAQRQTSYEYTHCDVLQSVANCLYNNIIIEENLEIYAESEIVYVTRQKREQFYSQNGLDHLLPYDKQWYSWYCSVRVLQKYSDSSYLSSQRLCHVLEEIYRAIKTISDPTHPTSNIVLRELFKVRETLHSEIGDEADPYGGDIDVLEDAEDILVGHIKENYLEWSIPLVLDPRYKLEYIDFIFSRAFDFEAEEYISKITEEIKELFTCFSIDVSETTAGDQIHGTEMTSAASAHQLEQAWGEHRRRRRSEVTKTELDRYLEGPLIDDTDGFDILNWWKINSSFYPTLARIARAALAMPTSSKLSSELMSQIMSWIRGYSKKTQRR